MIRLPKVKNPTAANMPTITIKNKPFTLKAEKVDAVNGNPVSGAVFELYREVKEAGTNYPRPDYVPMDGFENLVTEEDGTIPDINMDKLTPRTYYLREKRNPALYMSIDYDIRLIIRKTGQIEIQKAEFSEAEGRYVFSEITDNSAELVTDESGNVTLVVRDEPAKVVKILKKAKMEYGEDPVLGGAEFKLYKASQIDAETGKPKEGEKPLIEGKTGQDGILNLGALNDNAEYYLYETKAPKGYEATDTPIIIKVKKNGTVQRKTGENEYEDVPTVKEGDVEVATIEVYNLARFKLQLTKSLPVYVDNGEGNNTAIVFELNGYAVDEATGKEVVKYHKTVGIEFTKDGPREQTITVENIPGGLSRLMVKEAFGGNFKPKDAAEQQASGPDEKGVYTVSFENELNNKTHGSGVVNKYEQDEDGQFHHIKPQE